MAGEMVLRIWDVEHGACTMLHHRFVGKAGRLAMIDSGDTQDWKPSEYIRETLGRQRLDYLFITNADQDHMSDLNGLWEAGIDVPVWYRNPSLGADEFRKIKEQNGCPLTSDAKRYLSNLGSMTASVDEPFDHFMGGITARVFCNNYPAFNTTNDLSLAVFISFAGFTILFPGDLEERGWLALLENSSFRERLAATDVLVASHHGRQNGYCQQVFDYCQPRLIVMSDKAIVHDTQAMAQIYGRHVSKHHPAGAYIATTRKNRLVLTTRNDGYIQFVANEAGFTVETEFEG